MPWNKGLTKGMDERVKENGQKISKKLKWRFSLLSPEEQEKIRKQTQIMGKGMIGKHLSKETKLKISKIHKGKTLSEETKKKISESLLKNPNIGSPLIGKKLSEKEKLILLNSHLIETEILKELKLKNENVFHPQSVCDVIEIDNKKLIFLEIKTHSKIRLSKKQEKFKKLIEDMNIENIEYKIIYREKNGEK